VSASTSYPQGFSLHPRVARLIRQRRKMLQGRGSRSTGDAPRRSPTRRWSEDGFGVRLTGQDSGRGTFSIGRGAARSEHRCHVDFRCSTSPTRQPRVQVIDQLLSEEA